MMPAAVRWKRFDAEVLFLNPNDAARGIAALIDAGCSISRMRRAGDEAAALVRRSGVSAGASSAPATLSGLHLATRHPWLRGAPAKCQDRRDASQQAAFFDYLLHDKEERRT
jgi:hypothetical protein